MTKTRTVKSISRRWLELVLIGCALLAFFCASIQHIEFHPDESYWIATSDHFEAFAKAEFASPVWHDTYWTHTGLPLTRYLVGIGRRIGGYRVADLILRGIFVLTVQQTSRAVLCQALVFSGGHGCQWPSWRSYVA